MDETKVLEIENFFKEIYGKGEGTVYTAVKKRGTKQFEQTFYKWPEQLKEMAQAVYTTGQVDDVYMAPALFSSASPTKNNFKQSSVVWVELDNVPKNISNLPEPSIRVQSSVKGKEHWYWRINFDVNVEELEKITRSLTYLLGADISGWDATQILRPPNTLNFKYEQPMPVQIIASQSGAHGLESFSWLPEPPPEPVQVDVQLDKLPEIESLIFSYTLPPEAVKLFAEGPEDKLHGKSAGLMRLMHYMVEAGFNNEAALSMLIHADTRWGKFSKRNDAMKHYLRILSVARDKHGPVGDNSFIDSGIEVVSFKDIVTLERELEWLIEGILESNGNVMLAAAPGVGKTQLTLQAAAHLALGKDFLGFKVNKPCKVLFFSFEMDDLSLKVFLSAQAKAYTPEELDYLDKNFKIYPLGGPMALNSLDEQKKALDMILSGEFDGVLFDSLSRSTDKSLVDDVAMRVLMGWIDTLRSKYKIFVWWIHHNRKPNGDNKKPTKLADLYGSVFITSPITTGMIMWPTSTKGEIELYFIKSRLSAEPDTFNLIRDPSTLTFSRKNGFITVKQAQQDATMQTGISKLTSNRIKPLI